MLSVDGWRLMLIGFIIVAALAAVLTLVHRHASFGQSCPQFGRSPSPAACPVGP